MVTKIHVSLAATVALALLVLYYVWTAAGSSVCATQGIYDQTRTTWSPSTGCVWHDGKIETH